MQAKKRQLIPFLIISLLLIFVSGCTTPPCVCDCNCPEPTVIAAPAPVVEETKEAQPEVELKVEEEEEEEETEVEEEEEEVEVKEYSGEIEFVLLDVDFEIEDANPTFGHITNIEFKINNEKTFFTPRIKMYVYEEDDDLDIKSYVEEDFTLPAMQLGAELRTDKEVNVAVGRLSEDKIVKLKLYDAASDELLKSTTKTFNFG